MPKMPEPLHHSELGRLGFKRVDTYSEPLGRGRGTVTTHHYVATTNAVGGQPSREPVLHHAIVREYGSKPGKYDVSYRVTQHGLYPFSGGMYDAYSNHKDNDNGGSVDPIRDTMGHHSGVLGAIGKEDPAKFADVDSTNLGSLAPRLRTHDVSEEEGNNRGLGYEIYKVDPRRSLNGLISLNSARDRSIMEKADEDLRP